VELSPRLARLAPVATGATASAVVLLASPSLAVSVGLAASSAIAGFLAGRRGFSRAGSHLKAASIGVLVGAVIREASSLKMPDGFTWTGSLQNAAFHDLPQSALVHAPPGFDPSRPFAVLVYFRGWGSCVTVLAGSEAAPCSPGGQRRTPSDLIGQVDRSGVNALLVMPEWRLEEQSSSAGALAREGGFRAMLDEVMASVLSPRLGRPVGLEDASRIVLAGHSGGYAPMAVAMRRGGLPRVDDVLLLDALYGDEGTFAAHARGGKPLASLFTAGVTERRSESLAADLGVPVIDAGRTPSSEQWSQRVLIARTSTPHSNIPMRSVQGWLETRGLPSR